MSFFIKGKPKLNGKRPAAKSQPNAKKQKKGPVKVPVDNDEEIDSDDEVLSNDGRNVEEFSDGDQETAQDKRLRLAKTYLEEIAQEEKNRAEDKDTDKSISQRLANDYLDKIGRLRKNVADQIKDVNIESIRHLRHKLHKLPITSVCISSDNKFFFTGSKTPFVIKWELETLTAVGSIDCSKNEESDAKTRPQVWTMAVSTDFKFLVVGDKGHNIKVYCPKDLKYLHTFKGHRDIVTGLVFRKETHQLFSCSRDRTVKVWSLDEMAYIETLFGHQAPITGIDALSRERLITCGGSDTSIRIWKISEESQLIYNGHKGSIEDVKLISEENFVSCGEDGSICIWSSLKKRPVSSQALTHGQSDNGESNWISALAAVLNSDVIATGSCDGFIRLWKLTDNNRSIAPLAKIPVKGFVNSLSFTHNCSHLIAGIGQEHRLGRWTRIKDAKNEILVIPLE